MQMFLCLMLSQRSLRLSSSLFILFSIFCPAAVIPTILASGHLSLLLPQLSSYEFIPVYYSSACLFFSSYRSLVNTSCIFLIFASILFFKILDDLHYHYSEFFFWKVAYLNFIWLFFWCFILSLHLVQNPLLFHPGLLSVMRFCF